MVSFTEVTLKVNWNVHRHTVFQRSQKKQRGENSNTGTMPTSWDNSEKL